MKGENRLQELAAKYGVALGQISEWKQQLQQGAAQLFVRKNKADKNLRKLEKKVNGPRTAGRTKGIRTCLAKKRQ